MVLSFYPLPAMLLRFCSLIRSLTFFQRVQALLGLALIMDTLVLVACGRFNTGTILPGVIGFGLLGVLQAREWIARNKTQRGFRQAWRLGQTLAWAWLLSFLLFVGVLLQHGSVAHTGEPSVILVLGAGVHGREPTPTLINRLALAQQLAQRYPRILLLVSGGLGPMEEVSEAQAMRDWLVQKGINPSRIVLEERSTSTAENFAFSAPILQKHGIDPAGPIAVVTSHFHVLRVEAIAARAGYTNSWVVPAPSPLSIAFNNYLREYFAWGKSWLWGEVVR
jgi:uncharacterized SAM-binding protein YcdF (DUF218 family)